MGGMTRYEEEFHAWRIIQSSLCRNERPSANCRVPWYSSNKDILLINRARFLDGLSFITFANRGTRVCTGHQATLLRLYSALRRVPLCVQFVRWGRIPQCVPRYRLFLGIAQEEQLVKRTTTVFTVCYAHYRSMSSILCGGDIGATAFSARYLLQYDPASYAEYHTVYSLLWWVQTYLCPASYTRHTVCTVSYARYFSMFSILCKVTLCVQVVMQATTVGTACLQARTACFAGTTLCTPCHEGDNCV
jgi:hypothetical protein